MDNTHKKRSAVQEYALLAWLGAMKLAIILVAITTALGGCSTNPMMGVEIAPPAPYLMAPPKKFPLLKDGDDARQKLAEAAETHNREARRIKGLQHYIRTVRGE